MNDMGSGTRVDPVLPDRLRERGGAVAVLIADARDETTARAYAVAARLGLRRVRHPEEPDEPAVSFASALVVTTGGTGFSFDASDVDAYPGLAEELVDAMASELRAIGAECLLTTFPDEDFGEIAPEACRLPSFRQDFPLPSSAEQIDRTGEGHISFVSRETVDKLLAFLTLALEELGYPLGEVFEHDIPHPEWPALIIHGVALPIQVDGQVALTTVRTTGPLPGHVLAELERMRGLVQVNVILDPIEPASDEEP